MYEMLRTLGLACGGLGLERVWFGKKRSVLGLGKGLNLGVRGARGSGLEKVRVMVCRDGEGDCIVT